ncbi:MAG: hypothetical protein RBR93_09090 [Aliarcobacter butzleri]|nr:hypothetical protein [Aliarcobacter butzleri]
MNKKAVEGYLMARNFMLCYKAENTPKDELALVSQHLDIIVAKYQRGKLPIKKYLNNGWDFFREKVEDENNPVSVLALIIHLILKNPDREKHKKLTSLAESINKQQMFSRNQLIRQGKILVNYYYGKGIEKIES